MILRFLTARKEHTCAECKQPIEIGTRHIVVAVGLKSPVKKMQFRLHFPCLSNWDANRPRRKPAYKGRIPLTITEVGPETATQAYSITYRPLTDAEKRRRAVLITMAHRGYGSISPEALYAELEALGGIPRGLR